MHIRAAHILLLLPAVQDQAIVFSEVSCAITIMQSSSRPVVHITWDTLIQIIDKRVSILNHTASLAALSITDSRLFIARHQSREVHIRGEHLLISSCLVQVDIPPWIEVSL